MSQVTQAAEAWELPRETVELIPLAVETYTASAGWVATTSYTISVVAATARPVSFSAPTSDGGLTGYLVNGPTLSAGNPGNFWGFVKIDGAVQDPVTLAFTLRLV